MRTLSATLLWVVCLGCSKDRAPDRDGAVSDAAPSRDAEEVDAPSGADAKVADAAPGGDAKVADAAPGGDAKVADAAPGGDAKGVDAAPAIDAGLFSPTPTLNFTGDALDPANWMAATWSFGENATMFRTDHLSTSLGKLVLLLEKKTFDATHPYQSGHYQTLANYGFGRYEVRMRPSAVSGVVSSFFLFSDDEMNAGRWNEVDIEFICTSTGAPRIQFNHIVKINGALVLHEKQLDSSALVGGHHDYAIEYLPGSLRFYIDGVLKHEATAELPSKPMKVMLNLWRPTETSPGMTWAGPWSDATLPTSAEYDLVRFYPLL